MKGDEEKRLVLSRAMFTSPQQFVLADSSRSVVCEIKMMRSVSCAATHAFATDDYTVRECLSGRDDCRILCGSLHPSIEREQCARSNLFRASPRSDYHHLRVSVPSMSSGEPLLGTGQVTPNGTRLRGQAG